MKYAFLGGGKMAQALAKGMLRAKVCGSADLVVSDRLKAGADNFATATSGRVMASNAAAAEAADVVLLCVKPGDAASALQEAGAALKDKLLISIVSGLTTTRLREWASGARVIRVMPNTAAMVGMSATAVAVDTDTPTGDVKVAETIFGAIGQVHTVPENLLDAVTGLSGSGPAYVFLMIEALADGGVAAGLPRTLAQDLAVQTVRGAAETVAVTGEHPALLREMVTSPGGTTIAALGVLEKAAVRSAFVDAVKVAAARSRELSGD